MQPPVITGEPVVSPVILIGQAPGDREGDLGKPFAWTAGKTMFAWFQALGVDETRFRQTVYIAAVCRCFPGKNPKGGDRVPSRVEIANCSRWLQAELEHLRPRLLIPVGKLAISQIMPVDKLKDVIGVQYEVDFHGLKTDAIPLPHPSGASTWHRTEPGKTLLRQALEKIGSHPAWKQIRRQDPVANP
jgi:uracil-DNA glycosylase